jgi:hypothetical protein
MLARRLTTILPAMTLTEALDTTRTHRVAGLTGDRTACVTMRPCRAPHHTLSVPACRLPRARRGAPQDGFCLIIHHLNCGDAHALTVGARLSHHLAHCCPHGHRARAAP